MDHVHELMREGFYRLAGPLALLGFCFWIAHYWHLLREAWQNGRNRILALGLFSLILAGVVYGSVRVDFKVLSDETNLLSVANMLTQFGKASNTQQWLYYYHEYHPQGLFVPTRPVLFPVLTSLVQAAIGMSWKAPFVVNFVFYALLAGFMLSWARGFAVSIAMMFVYGLAMLMNPALSVTSASAGFDLVSLFFGFAVFLAFRHYLRRRDEFALRGLLLAAICFASVRYESILVFPALLAGLFWLEGEEVLKKISWPTWIGLFVVMMPLIIQRGLTWGSFENDPGVAPFSLGHLVRHLPEFANKFFLDLRGPYPVPLHWLGLAGVVSLLRRPKSREEKAFFFTVGGYVFLQLGILLSHHMGFAGHPTQVRLFVPFSFALTLAGFPLFPRLLAHAGAASLLTAMLLLFTHHHRFAVRDDLANRLSMTREMRFLRDFGAGADRPQKGEEVFVYDRPGQLFALGESAISWPNFLDRRFDLEANLRRGLFRRVLFIERIPFTPKADDPKIDPRVDESSPPRRPVFERQITETEKLVISEFVWK